jgi:hypothetical protein
LLKFLNSYICRGIIEMDYKKIRSAVLGCGMAAVLLPATGIAGPFMTDWYFDADKDGSKIAVSEFLNFSGMAYIENTFNSPSTFTFTETAFFQITGADGGGFGSLADANDPTIGSLSIPSNEVTGYFSSAAGVGTLAGSLSFTAGSLTIYSDAGWDYGTTAGNYGADNGTPIGTFDLVAGYGTLDGNAVPNGQLTLQFEATSLEAGYWFDNSDVDLSTRLANGSVVFGFGTSGASTVTEPNQNFQDEMAGLLGIGDPELIDTIEPDFINGILPTTLVVSNDGQWRMSVPEPNVLALMGLGLIGFGFMSRRKKGMKA